ncbi:Magnetosome protein MamH [Azospirillaceae bacterium]|nr:magnetosome protein MamH_2 [uncultured bacterium]
MSPELKTTQTGSRPDEALELRRWNALYLVAALAMIFVTLAVAIQPLFLRRVLGVTLDSAGMINANVEVVAELLTLAVIGALGVLSDRYGRVPILVGGFAVGALGGFLAPFSFQLGTLLGIGGIAFYYFARVLMALGTCSVWPQLATLAGDLTDRRTRARRLSNVTSMMAFGSALVFAVLMQIPRHSGVVVVMLFNAGLGMIGAELVRRLLTDVVPRQPEQRIPWQPLWSLLVQQSRLRVAFAAALFSRGDVAMIGLFYMLWTVYFADLVGKSPEQAAAHAGSIIGIVGLVLVATSLAWGLVIDRLGRLNAIIAGMAASGTGFLLMGTVVNPFDSFVLIPLVLIALGQMGALLAPDILALDLTPQTLRGSMIGALNVVSGIGIILLLEIGGYLFDHVGPYAPFVLMGTGNLLVMSYALASSRRAVQAA